MKPQWVVPLVAMVTGALLVGSGTNAWASGFQLIEQNASGLGNAYAGQAAAAENASTIFYNPAGMTRIKGKSFVVGGAYVGINTTFNNTNSRVPVLPAQPPSALPVPLGSTGGNAGAWNPVPNAYLSWQVADKVWAGVGASVPFGLKTDWSPDWMGRWNALTSDVKTININPSLAVELTDQVSIGVGASAQRLSATLSSAVPYGGIALAVPSLAVQSGVLPAAYLSAAQTSVLTQLGGPAGLAREGVSTVEGHDWKWGFNAGILVHPKGDKVRIGASYRSRIKHEVTGDVTFAGAPTFSTAGPLGLIGAAINARFANGPVKTTIELPDTLSVAAAVEATDKVQLLADYTFTHWKTISALTINRSDDSPLSSVPLNFQDTFRVGLGANIKARDNVTVRLGTAYDKAPVQDLYRTPRLPDAGRIWASAGAEFKVGKSGAVDIGYTHIFIKSAVPSDLQPVATDPTSYFKGYLIGTYDAHVDIAGAQFKWTF